MKKVKTKSKRLRKSNHPDAENRLLDAAEFVFAELGYSGATVKDVANRAGVNVALVSYYFSGKEGLFLKCIERTGQMRLEAAEKLLVPAKNFQEFELRLKLWVEHLVESSLKQKNVFKILHRGFYENDDRVKKLFQKSFVASFYCLINFLTNAQRKGFIRKDLQVKIMASLFFGGLVHILQVPRIKKKLFGQSMKDKEFYRQVTNHAIAVLLSGIQKRK